MDVVSDVLRAVRLSGMVVFHTELTAPWGLAVPPPMTYLTHWRIQLATQLLRDSHAGVAAIAEQVGYASEAAFNRAFRRVVGLPPAAWRRQAGRA